MLTLAFRVGLITPLKATEQWLCQNRHSGQMGFWAASLVALEARFSFHLIAVGSSSAFSVQCQPILVLQVLDHAKKLGAKLPETDAARLSDVLTDIGDPATCWEKFIREGFSKVDAPLGEDEDAVVDRDALPQTQLAIVKEKFNKATGAAIGCQFHLNGCRARQQITLRTVEGGQSRRIKKDLGSLVFL